MSAQTLVERLTGLVEPIVEEMGLFVYDLEVMPARRLRIRVVAERKSKTGSTDGITIDECAELSRRLDQILELEEVVTQPYLLEVSSPGLERRLKTPRHFEHAVGERLEVIVIETEGAEKIYLGTLEQVVQDEIALQTDNTTVTIPLSRVKKARTRFEFQG